MMLSLTLSNPRDAKGTSSFEFALDVALAGALVCNWAS